MPNIENLTKRKITGGKRRAYRGKRRRERKAQPRVVEVGELITKSRRVRGGNIVTYVVRTDKVNVATPEGTKNVKILSVVSNPANRDYERRGVITKGAIVATELGKVRITSKPSKNGALSGVLLK
ncbi:MAG: 30S ribosomal protein S8e [Conexivisphaerales archaeon]|nr:30S ribosomal protein S8e [Conexivisphaerales archaeon]